MLEEFAPHVGSPFAVSLDEAEPPVTSLELTQAQRSPRAGANGRPFSLVFAGSADARLEQGTYWLAREGEAPQPIFLVPIALDRYEAIFN